MTTQKIDELPEGRELAKYPEAAGFLDAMTADFDDDACREALLDWMRDNQPEATKTIARLEWYLGARKYVRDNLPKESIPHEELEAIRAGLQPNIEKRDWLLALICSWILNLEKSLEAKVPEIANDLKLIAELSPESFKLRKWTGTITELVALDLIDMTTEEMTHHESQYIKTQIKHRFRMEQADSRLTDRTMSRVVPALVAYYLNNPLPD